MRNAFGSRLATAFGGVVAAFGTLILLSVAAGPASAQTDYPPRIPPVIVPPNSALPAPAPSVLGIVVVATTTTSTTTTALPAPAVVLDAVISPPKVQTQVLGEVVTSPAFTGSNSAPTALAGLGLFAAGSVLVIGARRRRAQA